MAAESSLPIIFRELLDLRDARKAALPCDDIWMLKDTMGADGEFDRRKAELTLLNGDGWAPEHWLCAKRLLSLPEVRRSSQPTFKWLSNAP